MSSEAELSARWSSGNPSSYYNMGSGLGNLHLSSSESRKDSCPRETRGLVI